MGGNSPLDKAEILAIFLETLLYGNGHTQQPADLILNSHHSPFRDLFNSFLYHIMGSGKQAGGDQNTSSHVGDRHQLVHSGHCGGLFH
jgi:hypothetical protein